VNDYIKIKVKSLINIAVEVWRLDKLNIESDSDRIAIKRFINYLQRFLEEYKVEIIDLTEQPYEPGMAVEIVFTEGKDVLVPYKEIITEMVRPVVLIDGKVVKHGQVVTKKVKTGG
jgi:hypothetical protein